MKQLIIVTAAILFNLSPVISQSGINAEIRSRFILDNGYKKPRTTEEKPMSYITQRTRLNAIYATTGLETYISVQDVRYWGDDNKYSESGPTGNTESISLHQGWIRLKPTPSISLTAGRQMFKYDDQRILASRGWKDTQVTYDAFLFRFDNTLNKVDLALSWNAEPSANHLYPHEKFRLFDFIRYERIIEPFRISSIMLLTGNTMNDTTENLYMRGTFGINLNAGTDDFNARITFYNQRNLNQNGPKLNSYCFSFFAQRHLLAGKASVGAGLDLISGQDETVSDPAYSDTDHRFNILYGSRHGWYGYMDYFSKMPEQGLQDYMLKAEYKPSGSVTLQMDYHYFMLASDRFDSENPGAVLKRNLGHELDVVLTWNISQEISLQAGYLFYLTTATLEQIKGVQGETLRFPQMTYLMLTVKPELFSSRW